MDHEACVDRLPLWIAGALPAAEDQAVRRHLAECANCRAAHASLADAADAFAESAVAPDWTDHGAMRAAFRRQLPAAAPAPRPRRTPRLWPVLWAASLLVALSGWGVAVVQGQATSQVLHLASSGHRVVLTAAAYRASQVDLYWQHGQALVWVRQLPPLAAGDTYEGWWIVNGKPVAAGTFGHGPHLLSRPAGAKAFAVTVEPVGGTTAPTTPVLASASV